MKKNGKIPPHFLYFMENEGIEMSDLFSSNLIHKDLYDKINVKLPYSVKTLDIQVIFDNIDCSLPPDILFVKENNILVDYEQVFKNWNFKESSSLYVSLIKLKEIYSQKQEIIFLEESQNINNFISANNYDSNLEILFTLENIVELINYTKNKIKNYKHTKNANIEMILNYGYHMENLSNQNLMENMKNSIIFSYPLDINFRSRNVTRSPSVSIIVPICKDATFYMSLIIPHYLSPPSQNFQDEVFYLKNFESHISIYEREVLNYFKLLNSKELILNKIVESNIGFPIEIDTFSFNNLTLYFHHNKNTNVLNSSLKGKSVSSVTPSVGAIKNLLLYFQFIKEENKLEFTIINCDMLKVENKIKYDYSKDDKDINSIINKVLKTLMEFCVN
jgi:hypothetical protein